MPDSKDNVDIVAAILTSSIVDKLPISNYTTPAKDINTETIAVKTIEIFNNIKNKLNK